jgi:tRNA(fMet)-specific endonuclease VapC
VVIGDEDDVAISAVTVAELLVGVELADRRRRPRRERYVAEILATLAVEAYDTAVARAHASLLAWTRRSGSPRGAHDLIIAATALERNRIVVSADETGFADLPGLVVRRA